VTTDDFDRVVSDWIATARIRRRGVFRRAGKDVVRQIVLPGFAVAATLIFGVTPALAQLNTQHIKGGVGLKAGSQPPPHTYVVLPLFYVYTTDDIRNAAGDRVPLDASISSVAYGAGIVYVTERKILGGHYGTQVLFPVGANNRLQGTEIDQNPGAGLTDSAIQPISIGWHFKRADAIAAYNIYVPTGRYADGAQNNTGFGMWGHELQAGTTVFLDAQKRYHAATVVSFDFQSEKEDSETKVGNTMFLEGGVGGDFLKGGLTAGLAYYGGWKLSEDHLEGFPFVNVLGKNTSFALAPEASLALVKNGTLYGFLRVAYYWELYARATTKGRAFTFGLTLPYKPIKLPG
jgi:hypothetical protein